MDILLVEPDYLMASLVISSLTQKKHKINIVDSAQGAVDWLDSKDRRCDLIIMEPILANNSGIELIHELRSYEDWVDIPIIIHSRIDFEAIFNPKNLKKDYGIHKSIIKGANSLGGLEKAIDSFQEGV